MHRKVIKFIKIVKDSFRGSSDVYTRGSCYKFFEILKFVFPSAECFYYSKHILTKINDRFYDINGEVKDRTLGKRKFKKYKGQFVLHKCKFDVYSFIEKSKIK